MMRHLKRIMPILLVLVLLFTVCAHAAYVPGDEIQAVPKPRMTVNGNIATCSVKLLSPGKTIDATLELKQGSTVIASWSGSQTGTLTLSGTATVTSGVTYTLTVSGTIDGVAFTPESITKTP